MELSASVEEIDPAVFFTANVSISPDSQFFERDGSFIFRKGGKTMVAFDGKCDEIKIPAHVEVIGPRCFCGIGANVTFARDSCLKRIGDEAFQNRWFQAVIPDSVEEIGERCFSGSQGTMEIIFGENSRLKYIGRSAFDGHKDLDHIRIPASVEKIDDECFSNCRKLRCVTFASGSCLKSIGRRAFYNCCELQEIEIPASVEEIGDDCFGADEGSRSALSHVKFAK